MKKFERNNNNYAVAYYRYSSHSQSDASTKQQRELAEAYAQTHDIRLIKEYVDEEKTGTNTNRPGYQQMLLEIKKLKPAFLIIWKTDRLGRDRTELAITKRHIRNLGVEIITIAEPRLPADTPEAALFDSVIDGMAEFYSKQLGTNITRGLDYNAKHCLYNGNKTFGYTKEPAFEYGKDKYKFAIDPKTAPIVKRIFDEYLAGIPMKYIAKSLNLQGLTSSKGRPFTINGIRSILKNDAYTGIYRWGDIVVENGIPAIIDKETFNKVQKKFKSNKRLGSKNKGTVQEYWLTGTLYCGICGESMHSASGTGKKKQVYYYYACKKGIKHKCITKRVRKDWLETLILQILQEFLKDTENLASLAVDTYEYYKLQQSLDNSYIDSLNRELEDKKRSIDNLVKAIEKGIFSETTKERLDELESKVKMIKEAIEIEQTKVNINQESIQQYFEKFSNSDLSDKTTRDYILSYFIDRIYLYKDKIAIIGKYGDEYTYSWDEVDDGVDYIYEEFESIVFRSTN